MADADAATLPAVEIDEGVFKYVLVEARCDKTSMLIVRGYNGCPYHQDVLDEAESRAPTWKMKPLGGGRIEHRPGPATISIYGYSQAFGQPDHSKTQALCQAHFGTHYTVTWSNGGY